MTPPKFKDSVDIDEPVARSFGVRIRSNAKIQNLQKVEMNIQD